MFAIWLKQWIPFFYLTAIISSIRFLLSVNWNRPILGRDSFPMWSPFTRSSSLFCHSDGEISICIWLRVDITYFHTKMLNLYLTILFNSCFDLFLFYFFFNEITFGTCLIYKGEKKRLPEARKKICVPILYLNIECKYVQCL